MHDDLSVLELCDGVWRISAGLRGGFLQMSCYLVRDSGGFSLIDSGPGYRARETAGIVQDLLHGGTLERLIILDDGANAAMALHAWRSNGMRAPIVADWRVVLALRDAGISGPYIPWSDDGETDSPFRFRLFDEAPGRLMARHEPTGTLFCGLFASSFGRSLPEVTEDAGQPCLDFARYFSLRFPPAAVLVDGMGPRSGLLCPRFGSVLRLTDRSVSQLSACTEYAQAGIPELGKAGAYSAVSGMEMLPTDQGVRDELQRLRSANLELQSAMIFANDSALRDSLTGLYDRTYAEEFLRSLLVQGGVFSATFFAIDRLRQYNREAGVKNGDILVADVGSFLESVGSGAYLFRWGGPVFLLIAETGGDDAVKAARNICGEIRTEKRFARPVTLSAAVVSSAELAGQQPEDAFLSLGALARVRLKLLERKGGDDVLADSQAEVGENSMVLVLDGDALASDILVDYLRRQKLTAIGANRGGLALDLINQYHPELVVADAWLPQFDAFQVRKRMLESTDLRDIPFVLLVEKKTADLVARAHACGIFHIFEKPVLLPELVGVVRHLAEGAGHANEL